MSESSVSKLEAAVEAFTVPLRMGSGFSEPRYRALCEALRDCAAEWRNLEVTPKRAVNLLLDTATAVDATSGLYASDEARRIHEAAMELDSLVRACVAL